MTTPAKPIPALPGPYSTDAVITRLITVAGSQEGYREGRTGSDWNNDTAYGVWYPMNYNAWCAMLVSWSAAKAGIPETVIPKHAYTPTGYNWFKSKGQTVATPRRGDIFYVYSPTQGKVVHIGIVESAANGYVHTIEGNTNTTGSAQGDGVYRLTRQITSRLKFCRPSYAACVKAAPPTADKTLHLWALNYATKAKGMNGETLKDAAQLMATTRTLVPATRANELGWLDAVKAGDWTLASARYRTQVSNLQRHAGLTADGIPGPKTADYLHRAAGYTILP